MTVPRTALEERIFGAIRERILVPNVVAFAVKRAVDLVREGVASEARGPSAQARARLAEIGEELATLRRLAERGRARQVAMLVADLERERAERLATSPRAALGIDLAALRPIIEARVLEMRTALAGDPEERRTAFRELLGDRRMRVLPDEDRRFRVEGIFELGLEACDARNLEGLRASALTGSGDRYTPVASICRSRSQPSPGRSAGSPSAAVPAA
jgi:hypothetical protein